MGAWTSLSSARNYSQGTEHSWAGSQNQGLGRGCSTSAHNNHQSSGIDRWTCSFVVDRQRQANNVDQSPTCRQAKNQHTHTHETIHVCVCALKNNAKFHISRKIFALIYQKALGQNKKPEKKICRTQKKNKIRKTWTKKCATQNGKQKQQANNFQNNFFSSARGINTFELASFGSWTWGARRLELGASQHGHKSCVHVPATLSFFI